MEEGVLEVCFCPSRVVPGQRCPEALTPVLSGLISPSVKTKKEMENKLTVFSLHWKMLKFMFFPV